MRVRIWLEPGTHALIGRDGDAYFIELGDTTLIGSETTVLSLLYQAMKKCEQLSEHGELAVRSRDYE